MTSLVGRLPVFDYHNLNGICYLRLKRQIDFAKSSTTGQHVFIIATDDSRLKIVVIPYPENSKENMVEYMQKSIANI